MKFILLYCGIQLWSACVNRNYKGQVQHDIHSTGAPYSPEIEIMKTRGRYTRGAEQSSSLLGRNVFEV